MSTFELDGAIISFNGRLITGYGEGSVVSISREGDEWENTVMSDGAVVSNKLLGSSATVDVTLRWNSPSNTVLQAEMEARTTGVFLCRLDDGTEYRGNNARIQKPPDPSFAGKHEDVMWKFFVERLEYQWSAGENG